MHLRRTRLYNETVELLFHTNSIDERGVSFSVSKYIEWFSSKGFDCVWAFPIQNRFNNETAISYYSKYYNLRPYKDETEFKRWANGQFPWAYFQKPGQHDNLLIRDAYNAVHVVFSKYDPHGDCYAYISEWLAKTTTKLPTHRIVHGVRRRIINPLSTFPWVPYTYGNIIVPEGNLRGELGIPDSAFVILAIAGPEQFDISWVKQLVRNKIAENKRIYFLGINIDPFLDHKRAKFIKTTLDPSTKYLIMNCANVFLHGRQLGESFGMALLEAMKLGIPILSWRGGRDRHHLQLLDKNCLYRNYNQLDNKLSEYVENESFAGTEKNSIRATDFAPEKVMPRFESIFKVPIA